MQYKGYPEKCPVTGLPFFMEIEHPDLGLIPTYGGPYKSYSIPIKNADGNYFREVYDHDEGCWEEPEYISQTEGANF